MSPDLFAADQISVKLADVSVSKPEFIPELIGAMLSFSDKDRNIQFIFLFAVLLCSTLIFSQS